MCIRDSFYSYSNQSEALKNNPDTVYAYVPIGTNDATLTNVNGETVNWNIVNDVSEYGAGPVSYTHLVPEKEMPFYS